MGEALIYARDLNRLVVLLECHAMKEYSCATLSFSFNYSKAFTCRLIFLEMIHIIVLSSFKSRNQHTSKKIINLDRYYLIYSF